jgi:hypothetical protein
MTEPKDGDSRDVKNKDNVAQLKGETPKVDVSKNHAMTPPPATFNVKP